MKKDDLRLSRAFTEAPSELHDAVESAFQRGERAMKKRHKMMVALSAVAACALLLTALALAAVRLTEPRPDAVVAAKGGGETETVTEQGMEDGDALPTPLPEMMEVISVTPSPTPMLTPEPTALPELAELADVTPSPTPIPNALADGYGDIVYALAHGNYYHSDPNCSGMEEAVAWTEASAALMGKRPCPVCIGGGAVPEAEPFEVPVYYTEQGWYYHGDAHCSGMRNANAHTLAEAEADGKRRCPTCQPGEPDHYDLFLKAFGQGLYALVPGCAYSHCGRGDFFDLNAWYITDGEAEHEACRVESVLTADGGETRIWNATHDAELEDVICFTFDAQALDDLWPFLEHTALGEQARRGLDEAVEEAIEQSGLKAPVSVAEQSVCVAVGGDGAIKALDVILASPDGAVIVAVSFTPEADGFATRSRVEVIAHASAATQSPRASDASDDSGAGLSNVIVSGEELG